MDLAAMVTNDFDGWKVSLMKHGRVQVYLCATEELARRFAAFLSQPPVEKAVRSPRRLPLRSNRHRFAETLRRVAGL